MMKLEKERTTIVTFGKKLISSGLTCGTGGNLSARAPASGLVAVSPSGVPYEDMTPGDVVVVDAEGRVVEGRLKPTSEMGFHLALYRKRQDVGAVVHTHSPFATAFACLGMEIPAVHYLVGFSGSTHVPVAPYALFGSTELADAVTRGIGNTRCVLLANHGVVAVGTTLAAAFQTAEAVEYVAKIYHLALTIGKPVILSKGQMAEVAEKFKSYGQPPPVAGDTSPGEDVR